MARSPQDCLKLTPEDETAVKALEDHIDASPELNAYDGYEVKIPIPSKLYEQHLGTRKSTRTQHLIRRYQAAGWKKIGLGGSGTAICMILGQYADSYGSGKD